MNTEEFKFILTTIVSHVPPGEKIKIGTTTIYPPEPDKGDECIIKIIAEMEGVLEPELKKLFGVSFRRELIAALQWYAGPEFKVDLGYFTVEIRTNRQGIIYPQLA